MKRYEDFKNKDNETDYLTNEEMKGVKWTKYKIIVPTLEDKLELEKAFEHIHDSNIDTDNIVVNQLNIGDKITFYFNTSLMDGVIIDKEELQNGDTLFSIETEKGVLKKSHRSLEVYKIY